MHGENVGSESQTAAIAWRLMKRAEGGKSRGSRPGRSGHCATMLRIVFIALGQKNTIGSANTEAPATNRVETGNDGAPPHTTYANSSITASDFTISRGWFRWL